MSLDCISAFTLVVSTDVPCDLGVDDDTSFGEVSLNTLDVTASAAWTGLKLGTYHVQYINGGVFIATAPFGARWFVNARCLAACAGFDSNARLIYNSTTPQELPYSDCGRASLADLEANFDGNSGIPACTNGGFLPPQGRTTPDFQSFEDAISIQVVSSYPFTSFTPVAWELTRTKKPALDYQDMQFRIVDLASLLGSLTPFDSCTAGSGTVWDGTFPEFEPNLNYVNYEWRVTDGFDPFQLNGALLDTPAVTKIYHDNAGQATPTGCAWILAITYEHPVEGNVVSWVGLGGAGYAPQGTFVFSSDVVGWTMFGKKTAWRVATTAALPANTRVLNVLTANVNGALPAIDGVALSVADRVLVKNEGLGANNGSYVVTSLGSAGTPWVLTRSTDLDTSAEMIRGIFAPVTDGNTNAGLHFRLVTNGVITINVTSLSFTAIATTIEVELV